MSKLVGRGFKVSRSRGFLTLFVLLVLVRLYITYNIEESPTATTTYETKDSLGPNTMEFDQFAFTLSAFHAVSKPLSPGAVWEDLISKAFELPVGANKSVLASISVLKDELLEKYEKIRPNSGIQRVKRSNTGLQVNLAVIACGNRRQEALTMLKSATVFSQDSNLHVIVFSDEEQIFNVSEDILELRWQTNAMGWDFTFELHLDWFPSSETNWKQMYEQCATQRLFFPSLLPHIDSLIYLDSDVVVLSNLTDFFQLFNHMTDTQLAAAIPNNEPVEGNGGLYRDSDNHLPFYSTHGLNAGVMLMNLTRMREFKLQDRCIAVHKVYFDKIEYADQDIYNVIFHTYPEKFFELPCTYNFNWVHCGSVEGYDCYNAQGEHTCWCRALDTTGLRIVHGNSGTFAEDYWHFLPAIYKGFSRLDITKDSPLRLVNDLEMDYLSKPQNHCHRLTADMLYRNAKTFLHNLYHDSKGLSTRKMHKSSLNM